LIPSLRVSGVCNVLLKYLLILIFCKVFSAPIYP
jgi:hypothetical protein